MNDRFISDAPPCTPYEAEVLTILIEECSEVIHRASKILRFGPTEVQPGQTLTNVERLSLEVGDLEVLLDLVQSAGLIDARKLADGMRQKIPKLEKYMQQRRTQ